MHQAISEAGARGCTDFEVERCLGMKHQTVSSARHYLVQSGLVVDSGMERVTDTGRMAVVWVVASERATLPVPPPVQVPVAQPANALPVSQRGYAQSLAALTIETLTGHKQRLLWCVDLERDVGPEADTPLDPTRPDGMTRWGQILHAVKAALDRQPHVGQQCEIGVVIRYTSPSHRGKLECTFSLPWSVALTVFGWQPSVGCHRIWPAPPAKHGQRQGDQLPDSFFYDGIPF